jgi:hypothetical protein
MPTKVDTFLKASIAASVLIASASIAYYYLHYLPQRDAQVDRIRQLEQARIEFSRQAEQARLIEEKRAMEAKRAGEKEALQNRYQLCLSNAEDNYSRNWADQCKKVAAKAQTDRAECLAKGTLKATCDIFHPAADPSPNCTLSGGKVLNDRLQQSRDRCLQESRLGLQ